VTRGNAVVLGGVATVKEEFNTGKNNFFLIFIFFLKHGDLPWCWKELQL